MSVYSDWFDQLDEVRREIVGEISELEEIEEVKPNDESVTTRLEWLREARDHIRSALDDMNGVISAS